MRKYSWLIALVFVAISAPGAHADGITVAGTVVQSESDSGNSFVNNPSLNNIADGDDYTVSLNFSGSITAPGTYDLTGGSLVFSDSAATASESSFGTISLTVSPDGSSDDISLLGCLTTGDGCLVGNYLSLNFAIPSADLNSIGAPAATIFALSPALDLEEDDGVPDIQGDVSTYSYSGTIITAPEPSSLALLGSVLIALALVQFKRPTKTSLS